MLVSIEPSSPTPTHAPPASLHTAIHSQGKWGIQGAQGNEEERTRGAGGAGLQLGRHAQLAHPPPPCVPPELNSEMTV